MNVRTRIEDLVKMLDECRAELVSLDAVFATASKDVDKNVLGTAEQQLTEIEKELGIRD
jgi:hypothetical protein